MLKAYLDAEEVEVLEKSATNTRDRLLIRLLFHLGCRVSEALAITVADIDFVGRTVMIQHLKTRLNLLCPRCQVRLGRKHYFCSACGAKITGAISQESEHRRMRTLPIDEGTIKMLKEHIAGGGLVIRGDKKLLLGLMVKSWI